MTDPDILQQTRVILRRDLKLAADEPLPEDMRLVGSDLDLDSLDLLLLVTSIEKQFGVRISNPTLGKEVFETVGSLARYVSAQRKPGANGATAKPEQGDWLSRLPHGPEFRFVSRVVEVRPGESARGVWVLSGKEPFFAGHFPGNPIVPGVLIGEALAQVSGLVMGGESGRGKLVEIDLRFEQAAVPPVEIELTAKAASVFGSLHKCDVVAQIGSVVVARGTITLVRE